MKAPSRFLQKLLYISSVYFSPCFIYEKLLFLHHLASSGLVSLNVPGLYSNTFSLLFFALIKSIHKCEAWSDLFSVESQSPCSTSLGDGPARPRSCCLAQSECSLLTATAQHLHLLLKISSQEEASTIH